MNGYPSHSDLCFIFLDRATGMIQGFQTSGDIENHVASALAEVVSVWEDALKQSLDIDR